MRTLLSLLAVVALLHASSCWAQGLNTRDRLDKAHTALFEWLQDDDAVNATAWAQHLRRSDLFELLRVGPLANVEQLEAILEIYEQDTAGLETEPFAKVRRLLQEHIAALRSARAGAEQLIGPPPEFQEFDQAAEFQRRRRRLDRAITRVQRYLDNSGPTNARRWKAFFQWPTLRENVERLHEVTRLNREVGEVYLELRDVAKNFYGYTKGLGAAPFVELREALDDYLDTYEYLKSPQRTLPPEVKRRVNRLEAALVGYEYDYDPTARAAVGKTLEWLQQTGQGDRVVRTLRGRYWYPNVYARVSEGFAGSGLNDVIQDTSPVRDQLMGTTIRGTANTYGRYYIGFAPSTQGVSLAVCVDAVAHSKTVGQRGKVFVHSVGDTTIKAGKPLFFSEQGRLSVAGPATAKCDTSTRITGVSHRLRLVRKIAYRKALEYKPLGERYADDKGEKEAIDQLEKQVAPILKQANDQFASKIRQPLIGLELFPRWLNLRSSLDDVSASFVVANDDQLAAPNHPPQMPPNRYAGVLQVHESVLTNIADNLIRGFTLNNENTIKLLEELDREIPEELQSGEKWSMKFAESNSVVVRFNDNQIQLGFRGEAFSQGDAEERNVEIEFLATYEARIESRGLVLSRVGDVEGNVIEDRATVADVTVMSVVVKKFNAVFEPEIVVRPQKLPAPYDKAGAIRPAYFSCGYGWASAAINASNVR